MERWVNQEEAFQFAKNRPSVMLDMDMGTGKTRVAIDLLRYHEEIQTILVVCPKVVLEVWPKELEKHAPDWKYSLLTLNKGTVVQKSIELKSFMECSNPIFPKIVMVNYDIVWRQPLGGVIIGSRFDAIILDESHKAKSAGSKVSEYLAMIGKHAKYKYCLSGTPMANSPLDVYGQYRFLDPTIFGTRVGDFRDKYAIMGGPEHNFVVGYKNLKDLNERFHSIAYSCKMDDIRDRLNLPEELPPRIVYGELPGASAAVSKNLSKKFIAEIESKTIELKNVLQLGLRLRQITSGFCMAQDSPLGPKELVVMNDVKERMLEDELSNVSPEASVVVFCVFRYDIESVYRACRRAGRDPFELSGLRNEKELWVANPGSVLIVQIQAGAEGIDMTKSHTCFYYSLPTSFAQYNQSKARLYRPGQENRVSFNYIMLRGTIDEVLYDSLQNKQDLVDGVTNGTLNYKLLKH